MIDIHLAPPFGGRGGTVPRNGPATPSVAGAHRTNPASAERDWGQLPTLALVGAMGLLLVALADTGARADAWWSQALFWEGLLMLYVPIAARLIAAGPTRRERFALVALLSVGLYLVKLFHSPLAFTFHDELLHQRTLNDILSSGRLFAENSLLPVSPYYPGLESLTSAVMSLSGLALYSAGVLAVAVARLVLGIALFLFFEEVSRSPRIAGVASLIYMANPNYLFFGAQFAYESVALPFAALTLYAAARRARAAGSLVDQGPGEGLSGPRVDQVGLSLAVLLGLAAVVTTHHLTAYALAAFLGVWALADFGTRRLRAETPGIGGTALLAGVTVLTWLVYVAHLTVGYLAPNMGSALNEFFRLIAGEAVGRQLFRDFGGGVQPLWERLAGYASVAVILAVLPFGVLRIWQRYRANSAALALAIGALAYPPSLGLRLTQGGQEASNRASEFLFLALAFVLAVAAVEVWLERAERRTVEAAPARVKWKAPVFCAVWLTALFVGGTIIGWPPWMRLPGSYLVSADARSVEPQAIAAAEWAREYLGPGNRIATDRTNRLLMAAYGDQRIVTGVGDWLDMGVVLMSTELTPEALSALQRGRVKYVVVDRRLSSGLPMVGVYVEQGEPNTFRHTTPVDPAALAKFDQLPGVSRVFDSGDIVIYDVGALSGAS